MKPTPLLKPAKYVAGTLMYSESAVLSAVSWLKKRAFCHENGLNCKGCQGGCLKVILPSDVDEAFGVKK